MLILEEAGPEVEIKFHKHKQHSYPDILKIYIVEDDFGIYCRNYDILKDGIAKDIEEIWIGTEEYQEMKESIDKIYSHFYERQRERLKTIISKVDDYKRKKYQEYALDDYSSITFYYHPSGEVNSTQTLDSLPLNKIQFTSGGKQDTPQYQAVMINNQGIDLLIQGKGRDGLNKIKEGVRIFNENKERIKEIDEERIERLLCYGAEWEDSEEKKALEIPGTMFCQPINTYNILSSFLYRNLAVVYVLEGNSLKADEAFENYGNVVIGQESFKKIFGKKKGLLSVIKTTKDIEKELEETEKKWKEMNDQSYGNLTPEERKVKLKLEGDLYQKKQHLEKELEFTRYRELFEKSMKKGFKIKE